MTKQEKIKEEWIKSIGIDNYNIIKESICKNGTIYEYILRDFKIYSEDFLFKSNGDNEPDEYQLKSLQGIEDNNGWIKIESEEDYPLINLDCRFIVNGKIYLGYYTPRGYFVNHGDDIERKYISHYKPIKEDNRPIY